LDCDPIYADAGSREERQNYNGQLGFGIYREACTLARILLYRTRHESVFRPSGFIRRIRVRTPSPHRQVHAAVYLTTSVKKLGSVCVCPLNVVVSVSV
jgi:hypothetical protein